MKLFRPLYDRAITWSRHKYAPAILGAMSFFEAFIFPVMPEVMLAPMCLAQPRKAYGFAAISLAGSLLGAVVGYLLGHYAFELIRPLFDWLGWTAGINEWIGKLTLMVQQSPWGAFWTLVLAGFLPVPLKFFTWASGVVGVPMLPFMASMFVGRGKRVFLLALALRIGGERAEAALRKYIEPLGWIALAILAALVGWLVLGARH
jgi:membrane protein YqaA with SNARE-associated domain